MDNKALEVVREYLRMDATVRQNAVTALAALGDDEALDEIVHVALEDRSQSVVKAAERELLQLTGERLHRVASLLMNKVASPVLDRRAHGILGAMAKADLPLPRPPGSFPSRLRRVFRFAAQSSSKTDWAYRTRAILPGGAGTVVGMALFGLTLARSINFLPTNDGFAVAFFACLLSGLLLVISSSQRATAYALQYDRFAFAIFELLAAAVGGLITGAILLLFCAMSSIATDFAAAAIAGSVILAVAVRGGALAGVNCSLFGIRPRWWMLIAGGLAGFVATTALFLATRSYKDELCSTFWILLIPAGVGLANFYAGNEIPLEAKRRSGYLATMVCLFFAAAGLAVCGLVIAFPYKAANMPTVPSLGPGASSPVTINVPVPSQLAFDQCPPSYSCIATVDIKDRDFVVVRTSNNVSGTRFFPYGGKLTITFDFVNGWTQLLSPYLHSQFFRLFAPNTKLLTSVTVQNDQHPFAQGQSSTHPAPVPSKR